jgi:hypothetical protein
MGQGKPLQFHGIEWAQRAGILHPACLGLERQCQPRAQFCLDCRQNMEEFDTSGAGVHANWPGRFFAKIVDAYVTRTLNQGGRVGDAMSYILRARDLAGFASPLKLSR